MPKFIRQWGILIVLFILAIYVGILWIQVNQVASTQNEILQTLYQFHRIDREHQTLLKSMHELIEISVHDIDTIFNQMEIWNKILRSGL